MWRTKRLTTRTVSIAIMLVKMLCSGTHASSAYRSEGGPRATEKREEAREKLADAKRKRYPDPARNTRIASNVAEPLRGHSDAFSPRSVRLSSMNAGRCA
eukprot:2377770-Rhodomonas_salina.4